MAVRPISLRTESHTAEGWPEKIGTIIGAAVSVLTTAMIIWPLLRHIFVLKEEHHLAFGRSRASTPAIGSTPACHMPVLRDNLPA